MKNIKNAIFLKSIADINEYKGFSLPEIVVVGKSNVGKSSLINMLSGSKIAKVSSTQGKTKLINFFNMGGEFILVDLPGYGYAEVSKSLSLSWKKMIEDYLDGSASIAAALLLVDIRLKPSEQDIVMFEYFIYHNIPVTIVATKLDKIKKSERRAKLEIIARTFNVGTDNIFAVSAAKTEGKERLTDRIYQFVDGV